MRGPTSSTAAGFWIQNKFYCSQSWTKIQLYELEICFLLQWPLWDLLQYVFGEKLFYSCRSPLPWQVHFYISILDCTGANQSSLERPKKYCIEKYVPQNTLHLMEEYTGDTDDSDEDNCFSISPILKKVEKTKEWCRKNGLNLPDIEWICITRYVSLSTQYLCYRRKSMCSLLPKSRKCIYQADINAVLFQLSSCWHGIYLPHQTQL